MSSVEACALARESSDMSMAWFARWCPLLMWIVWLCGQPPAGGAVQPGCLAPGPAVTAEVAPALMHLLDGSDDPVRAWVFFRDKGVHSLAERQAAIDLVASTYNPRAVQRRTLRSLAARRGEPVFDDRDLPVVPAYVEAIAATGARVRVTSRWVNAVSVQATRGQIEAIARLPFVAKLQPVARSARVAPVTVGPEAAPTPDGDGGGSPRSINYGASQAQLAQMNLIALHDAGYTGSGVVIGMLDSGFHRTHVAFNDPLHPLNVVAEWDFIHNDGNTDNQSGDPSGQADHGTMTLSCLGAYKLGQLVGGAYNASFVLCKTEDTSQEVPAEEDNYVAGLEFIESHGGDMATSSLGYIDWYTQADLDGQTAVTTIAVNVATSLGLHCCTAAGNEYHDSSPSVSHLIAPADAMQVITCGAVNSTGGIASFSSDGPTADGRVKPELLARGVGASVVSPTSNTAYTTADGTSFSTPLTACVVACLIQARPWWTADQMRQHLFETADYYVANGTFDPLYIRGYGIVNAFAAFQNCPEAGTITLDRIEYPCQGLASLVVEDCGLNTNDNVVETVTVSIASGSEPGGESVVLTERAPDAAEFAGSISLATTHGVGVLWVSEGDSVTATYHDADDGTGSPAVAQATAGVDCTSPTISNVRATNVQARSAVVAFDSNELVKGTVRYGLSCGSLSTTALSSGYAVSPAIALTHLQDDTVYYYAVEAEDQAGNTAEDDHGGICYWFMTPEVADYFTELFESGNDLDHLSLLFVPNGSGDFYAGCVQSIIALPTDPAGGTVLSLSEDSNVLVNLTGGANVWLYGQSYPRFYVGANGYVTFTMGDGEYTESFQNHFDIPRISGLFDDLSPQNGGTVSWKQLADRAVVTCQNVPEYSVGGSNTFQIEMFFDGRITVSYLAISDSDGLAGLSAGGGVPAGFLETDLSAMSGPCGPEPPAALPASVGTSLCTPVTIPLQATDDGLPDPPGALTYVIAALPGYALKDAGTGHVIRADELPYPLAAGGHEVTYQPAWGFVGSDSFQFRANDGGVPPEGGDSNAATVVVQVSAGAPRVVHAWPLDSNPGWPTQGAWAFGQPTGGGTRNRDPVAGYTGNFVYGYNLNGDYTDDMPVYYLTSPSFDCSHISGAQLRFWRWLGVERADRATVEVSGDGLTWAPVWANPSSQSVADVAWTLITLDLAAVADGDDSVFVRWGMGPTDYRNTYPGWNIDDVEIWGVVSPGLGDADGDGDVDLEDFARWPDCTTGPGVGPAPVGCEGFDFDADEDVDLSDFGTFQGVFAD